MDRTGEAVFPRNGRALRLRQPMEILRAAAIPEVIPTMRRAEQALDAGHWIAGYVAYEAAPAFDPALRTHPLGELPLAWFGVYEAPETRAVPEQDVAPPACGPWEPGLDESAYHAAIARIHEHIVAGDTYQVNYTFPLTGPAVSNAYEWFWRLWHAQGGEHAGYINTGRFEILSASPELFFSQEGDRITSRPMKGTRPRGPWAARDLALREELLQSEKDRAENIMIVDMVRNDLGRIANVGSVTAPRLFEAERYETVWQMTSTVEAESSAGLTAIFSALFPPASVTGAPKVETMKIIHGLEPAPRGVYCGAVGFAGPERQASFNVAIRTAVIDHERDTTVYSIGSGITHGSQSAHEYQECLDKAALLSHARPRFQLLESLRLENGAYLLLEEHLDRLLESAAYFGIALSRGGVRNALEQFAVRLNEGPHKVRLLASQDGELETSAAPAKPATPQRVGFAAEPVDSRDVFLYHKTTHREVYTHALATRPDCDDVLLWNERGEVTESCMANVVVALSGRHYTPPVSSGLLAGTFRRHLLERGDITERLLTPEDVLRAGEVYLINSVRTRIPVQLVDREVPTR